MFPSHAMAGEHVVVLLHGLFATAGVLRPLRGQLETELDCHTASFTYAPGPGVDALGQRLAQLVRRLPSGVRVHLVGHSLGGLAVRWFVQELGGDPRIVQTVSLGSPFRGTKHGRFMPGPAGRDIVPGSPVTRRIGESAARCPVPHLSIIAEHDTVVTEPASLPVGEVLVIPDCGHNGLLFHPSARESVVRRVRALLDTSETAAE